MNLKKVFDKVSPYRQNRVSTKIGKSLADYYRSGKSLKPKHESQADLIRKEKEKRHAK